MVIEVLMMSSVYDVSCYEFPMLFAAVVVPRDDGLDLVLFLQLSSYLSAPFDSSFVDSLLTKTQLHGNLLIVANPFLLLLRSLTQESSAGLVFLWECPRIPQNYLRSKTEKLKHKK